MKLIIVICVFLLSFNGLLFAQHPIPSAEFNFDQQHFNEKNGKIITKPVGIKLVKDRFGNEESAIYLEGNKFSYLNLGNSALLKPKIGSISMWIYIERRVYGGRGYESNPIICTKNAPVEDFCDTYFLGYDFKTDRLGASLAYDSTKQISVNTRDRMRLTKWQHIVFSFDENQLTFYVDGINEGEAKKWFELKYFEPDSVIVGYNASWKNERYMRGMIDDVKFFDKVLSHQEILDLYNEPNPNQSKLLLEKFLRIAAIVGLIFIVAYILVYQRRRALKRSQEKYQLEYKFHEMEIRTLKAQMNPHFIFNCLNTIQQLILSNENEKAQTYLSKFSKLLRSLLEGNTNDNISLSDEVNLLKRYLEMESLRFGNKFSYQITIDDTLSLDLLMPHMMIQPFVENAIWHGLLPKKNEKSLMINFKPNNEYSILCEIDDNGVGRQASKQNEHTFKRKSLALSYVKNRLEILEGLLKIHCGVEIVDKYDKYENPLGTTVVVIIPIIKKSNYETSNINR